MTRPGLRLRDPRALALTLSLIVGTAWLRLRLLGFTEMWEDQALTLNAALEWVHGGPLPLASMKSSFGVFNPPLVQYLYAFPLSLTTDLLAVVWFVALVNLAGVLFAGFAAARVFGWRVAWWATLLFAANPWAVYYARLIWMQSFVPGFAALALGCALLYFADQPRFRWLAGLALALAAAIQVHLTAVVLLPILAVAAAVFRRALKWPQVLGAAALFALTWLPFLIFQVRNQFVDWHALRAGLGQPAQVSAAAILLLLDLLHGRGSLATLDLPPGEWATFFGPLPLPALVGVLLALALAAAAWGLVRHGRGGLAAPEWPAAVRGDLLLLLWTVAPLLFYLRHNQYLQNYYLLYILPAPFLLLARLSDRAFGWLAGRWPARERPRRGWLPVLAFAPLALVAAQQIRVDVLGQNRLASGAAGRQRVVDVREAIAHSRLLLAERPGCSLVVVSNGAQFESSRLALLHEFTRASADEAPRARFLQSGSSWLAPAPCALYLETESDPRALAWLESVAEPLPTFTVRTPREQWRFFDLPAAERTRAVASLPAGPPLGRWANGLTLRQAVVEPGAEPGGELEVTLVWSVEHAAPPRLLHFGVYLLDGAPSVVAQSDGPGVDSTAWQPGDAFATAFTLPLPADLPTGSYNLAVALYSYPEIERLPLADLAADLLYLTRITLGAQRSETQ